MSNTIKLKNYLHIMEEYKATTVAITPGMLLEVTSGELIQAHSTAGGNASPMFACEDELQGNGISDAYAASVKVQCWIPQRGDQALAILKDGEIVAIGDLLESGAGGVLVKHTSDDSTSANYPQQIVGEALEALDLSSSSGGDDGDSETVLGTNKRIKIRVL